MKVGGLEKDTADGGKFTSGQRSPRWAIMEPFDVLAKDGSGDVYLHRLRIIQTPYFGVYLHDLNLPDMDRHPHDHPWTFWSIVLRGGYYEEVFSRTKAGLRAHWGFSKGVNNYWGRWSIHMMPMDKSHRITHVEPHTVSLIFVGRRKSSWGFWTEKSWIDWREYV